MLTRMASLKVTFDDYLLEAADAETGSKISSQTDFTLKRVMANWMFVTSTLKPDVH